MSTSQWYMAIGGHQAGPVAQDEIVTNLRNGSIDASLDARLDLMEMALRSAAGGLQ